LTARSRRAGRPAREVIAVDGLAVELRRKPIKSLRLHVEPGGLIWLSLPPRTPKQEAVTMVRRHRRWLDQALSRQTAPPPSPRLWGEPLPTKLPAAQLDALYRRELKRAAQTLLTRWAPRVGRRPAKLTLRWMTSRWGSCNSQTGRVSLNLALANLPPEYLEQVTVHELVHLLEPNHGPGFKARMDHLLPNWRAQRAAMRTIKPLRRPT
jgi:predicted metal-dependent hydrolase